MSSVTNFQIATDSFQIKGYTSEDSVKLFIDIERTEVVSLTPTQLLTVLKEHIDEERVDQGVLADIVEKLKSERKIEHRRIARGRLPKQGAPGKLLFLVKKLGAARDDEDEAEQFVDHTNLHLFDNITEGQFVARVYPPMEGEPGEDAFGNLLPAERGEEVQLSFDDSLTLIPPKEGDKVRYALLQANKEGYLADERGKLKIQEELIVRGGLDYSFGSINFIGSVKIIGDILPGFRVQAKKGIQVEGSVSMANLVSSEGDITIKDFFHGNQKAKIVCTKNVRVKGVSQATLEVQGIIEVEKEVRESYIRTESYLSLPRGRLISGETYSVCGVEASEVGTHEGIETEIYLCNSVETSTAYHELMLNIQKHENAYELIGSHLGPYAENMDRIQLLKSPLREKMEKLVQKRGAVKASLAKLFEKKESLLEGARVSEIARVNALDFLHDGAIIRGGEQELVVKESLKGPLTVEYRAEDEILEQKELAPIVCTFESSEKSEEEADEQLKES